MPIRIADCDGSWEFEVPVDYGALSVLKLQLERAISDEQTLAEVKERIGERLAQAIADVVDPDFRSPTEAQLNYALIIAEELGVKLPREALKYRGAMHEFLERYAPVFKARFPTSRR